MPIANVATGANITEAWGDSVADELNTRGTVGYVELAASHGPITTVTDISYGGTPLSVTFTAVAGRRYRTTFSGEINGTVAGDLLIVYISTGANVGIKRHAITVPALTSGSGYSGLTFSVCETGLSGSTTRKIRLERNSGTGSASAFASTTSPMSILVEDLGEA